MFLIDNILLAPLNGLIFIGEKILELSETEMSDEGAIKKKLMELQLKLEMDEMDEKEYDRKEDELLQLLENIREKNKINIEKEEKDEPF